MADPFSGGIMPQIIQNQQGLQQLQMNKQQMEQQYLLAKQEQQADELLNRFRDGGGQDFSLVQKAVLLSPTKAQNVLATIGIADKTQKTQAAADIVTLRSALGNPETFRIAVAKRVQAIKDRGGDPTDTIGLIELYNKQGPEAVERELGFVGAALANEGYIKPELLGLAGSTEQPTSQREFEYYQRLQRENPAAAEKFARARGYIETGREQAMTPQERNVARYQDMVAKGDPNAEAFGRSAGLVSKEGAQLTATAEQEIQKSVDAADANAVNTTRYLDLASRFKESDITGGIFGVGGSWREALKTAVGSQDEVSKIIGDWTNIRSGEAIASLPQGPATDADIRLALKPLPENAGAEYMDRYLRGLAKIAEYKAEYAQSKANFVSENGSLRTKTGENFGKIWAAKRKDVLERIKNDPKFGDAQPAAKLTKEQFTGSQAPAAQPAVIGRFQIEVVE